MARPTASTISPLLYPPSPAPFTLRRLDAGCWYRIHDSAYPPAAFNDSGKGHARFSPIHQGSPGSASSSPPIPTLYASNSRRGAIAEILLHDAPFPASGYLHDFQRDRDSHLQLSAIQVPQLLLANLTATGLTGAGLEVHDLFGTEAPDYLRTQAWAHHIWANYKEAQGLLWMSRRDNTSQVIMLFGDRVAVADGGSTKHVTAYEAETMDLLVEMGAGAI